MAGFEDFTPEATKVASFDTFLHGLHDAESSLGTAKGINTPNSSGAVWDLQVTPVAAKDVGADYEAVKADRNFAWSTGKKYAEKVWNMFGEDPTLAAAAYHTGPTAIKRWIREAESFGTDPKEYVLNRLGPEGKVHNKKVVGKFGTDAYKSEFASFDVESGTFTSRDQSSPRGAIPERSFADFDESGDVPAINAGFKRREPDIPPGLNMETFKATLNNTVTALKGISGTTGVLGDMFLGLPSMVAGFAGNLGTTAAAAAKGEDRKIAWQAGREANEYFKGPEWVSSPLGSLFKYLGQEDLYSDSPGAKVMEKVSGLIKQAGHWAEKNSDGSVPAEAVETFADSLMIRAALSGARLVKGIKEIRNGRPAAEVAEELKARRPGSRAQDVSDAEIIETPKALPAPVEAKRPSFRDFEDTAMADAFIKDTLETSAKENIAAQKARRLKTIALGAAGPIGAGAAYVYQKLNSEGNEVIDATPAEEHEAPFPKVGNEVAGRTVTSDEYDKLLSQFGSLAAIPFAIGAVKGKGGMWHPEAMERLAKAIEPARYDAMRDPDYLARNPHFERNAEDQASFEARSAAREPRIAWSERAIKNYLNKYAGTEGDPLKDMEIPFGERTKKWGEITDKTMRGIPGENFQTYQVMQREDFNTFAAYDGAGKQASPTFKDIEEARNWAQEHKPPEQGRIKSDETVWTADRENKYSKSLTDYLSHVGDYLRQNVDPAKLQQYDLVRAVKETAKNDERVAKEMEKAATSSMKDMPVYKEYPDGMKWVELKLKDEGKLTKEQSERITGDESGYIANDASGKPIKNSYTEGIATGNTPEEAHLAGQLAQEGNQMGHCVGGYCEGVVSGESRIFSLRDKKGQSHVTIETTPPSAYEAWEKLPGELKRKVANRADELFPDKNRVGSRSPGLTQALKELVPNWEENIQNIQQIKGKQNRAPVAEYLPYVQDFVKSGKWGEVGDLGNTGLIKYKDTYATPEELRPQAIANYKTAIELAKNSNYYSTAGKISVDAWKRNLSAIEHNAPLFTAEYSAVYQGLDLPKSIGFPEPKAQSLEDFHAEQNANGYKGNVGGPRNQQGQADLRLVKALALAGIGATAGAALLPDDRLTAALVGGVLALGLGHTKISALPQLLAPGSKLARSAERKITQATTTFVRNINPDLMGKQAESAGSVLGKVVTDSMRKELGIEMGSIPRSEFWMRQGETRSRTFMKAYEKSATFTNPELNAYAIGYRDWMSRLSKYEQERGFTYDPVDNYLYHVWEDPVAVTAYFDNKYGTKWGDPGFTKDRNFKLIEEGEAAGFKLKTWNPETLAVMRQHASNAASLKADSLAELVKYELAKEVEKGMTAAPGETLWRSPNGKLYFLPDQVNQVMHNAFNTKSLWADTGLTGTAFRAVAYAKNILVPIQLAGLFHPMHVQLGPSFSDAMTSMTKLVAAGKASPLDLIGAGISKLALTDIYSLPKLGSDYVGALKGEIPYSKLTEPQKYGLTLMLEGSFNPIMPIEYRNRHMQDFRQAIIQAQEALQHGRPIDTATSVARTAWNLPWAMMEKFYTGPIFERWIPNAKSAAYLRGAYAALQANPQLLAQPLERMNALRRVAKQVDDRFGEMNYRTLFMNRTVKDIGVVSLLSYGWQAAFLRSYIGAVPELARAFQTLGDPYKPERLGGPQVITTPSEISKNLELSRLAAGMQKYNVSKSGFDYSSGSGIRAKIARGELDKFNNVVYYLMSTMFYGGLFTYAATGQAPEQLMDYIYPLSGEKNADGSSARLSTPFYTKDYIAYPKSFQEEGIAKGALKIVGHKLNPAIGMIDSIVRNKDFFNRELRDPNASMLTQIGQTLEFMTRGITPMSVSGPAKGPPGLKGQVLGVAGFNPAPKYVTDTPLEQKIKHEYGKYHNSVIPFAQARKMEDRSELYRLKQIGEEDKFEEKLSSMKEKYNLTTTQEKQLRTNAGIPAAERLFSQLPNDTQEKLLHDMSAIEQERFRPRAGKLLRYQ